MLKLKILTTQIIKFNITQCFVNFVNNSPGLSILFLRHWGNVIELFKNVCYEELSILIQQRYIF